MVETLEWVKSMEDEYKGKRQGCGFKNWFGDFYKYNLEFKQLFDDFKTRGRKGSPITEWERNFIGTIIAMSFYPNEYDQERFMTKSYRGSEKKNVEKIGAFQERKHWGNFLAKVWNGDCLNEHGTGSEDSFSDRFGKPTKATLNVMDCSKGDLHWIELCSALQKQFHVFDSLQTLNKFITTAFRVDHPDDLSDYGLYVRDIDDICIAFSILHGYSFEDTKKLIVNCRAIVEENQGDVDNKSIANKTLTQQLLDSFENKYKKMIDLPEDRFIQIVKSNAQNFLPIISKKHWSTYKKFLELVFEPKDKEWIQEERDFDARLCDINDYFTDIILPSLDDKLEDNRKYKKSELLKDFILNSLKLMRYSAKVTKTIKDEDIEKKSEYELMGIAIDQDSQMDKVEESISWLRRVSIVSLMKAIYEDSPHDNKQSVLGEININLEELNLRVIAFEQNGSEDVINTTTDLFDWFVIECLIRDQQCRNEDEGISGFKPFCDFLGIMAEDK